MKEKTSIVRNKLSRFNSTEKAMFIVTAALIAILIVKSIFFSEVRGLTPDMSRCQALGMAAADMVRPSSPHGRRGGMSAAGRAGV